MHQPTPDFELLYILFTVKKNISRFSEKIQKSKIERFSKIMKYKERMQTPLFSAHTSANLNPSSLSLSHNYNRNILSIQNQDAVEAYQISQKQIGEMLRDSAGRKEV